MGAYRLVVLIPTVEYGNITVEFSGDAEQYPSLAAFMEYAREALAAEVALLIRNSVDVRARGHALPVAGFTQYYGRALGQLAYLSPDTFIDLVSQLIEDKLLDPAAESLIRGD